MAATPEQQAPVAVAPVAVAPVAVAPVAVAPEPVVAAASSSSATGPGRGRGRPTKTKGLCTRPECNEPELCSGLCRRCYHQEYNQRKKTSPSVARDSHKDRDHERRDPNDTSRDRSAKRQRRRAAGKGPFTTAEGQVIDTPYVVEVSLNARTKCQICKDRISKDELRIGILRSKSPGACRWYHPHCFPGGPDFSLHRLHGRKKLDHDDRTSLKHLLSSPKKHKHRHRDRRSHSRSSSDLTSSTSKKKKHRSSSSSSSSAASSSSSIKEKKRGHKKETHIPTPIYQNDSSESSSSYSDVDDFDDEDAEESYSDSSQGSSQGSDDDEDFHNLNFRR